MCTSSVSNVIYHKFSHGAAFYRLNGKNVKVMLEYSARSIQMSWYKIIMERFVRLWGDNLLAKARGLSSHTGGQTMI